MFNVNSIYFGGIHYNRERKGENTSWSEKVSYDFYFIFWFQTFIRVSILLYFDRSREDLTENGERNAA